MYYITFFIKAESVLGFIVHLKGKNYNILDKQTIEIIDTSDISTTLNSFISQYCSSILQHQDRIIYRIILLDNQIMHRQLQLPNIGLQSGEIEQYIDSVLAKIFHTALPLSYDYLLEPELNRHQNLCVYAYPQSVINRYFQSIPVSSLHFLGITTDLLLSSTVLEQHAPYFEQLACQFQLGGINFLPWRQQQKRHKRVGLLIVIACYFLVSIVITALLFWQTIIQYQQQVNDNLQLQMRLTQSNRQLAELIELDSLIRQLQVDADRSELLKKRLMMLVNVFRLMSNRLPDGLWLRSFEYDKDSIVFIGESFSYDDILTFSQLIDVSGIFKQRQVLSVNQHDYLFQFNLSVQVIL